MKKIHSKDPYDEVVNRLINYEDDEGVLNKQAIKDLEKALKEIKKGKFIPHEEVKRKLGL